MIAYSDSLLTVYFGNSNTAFERNIFEQNSTQDKLEFVKNILDIKSLVVTKQIHSNTGVVVCNKNIKMLMDNKLNGDFLVTAQKQVGLCIYTADCLPIVFYDKFNHAIGICHAGWQGSVNSVAIKTVESMEKYFNTKPENLSVFFGPAAGQCCYEVSLEFRKHILRYAEQVIKKVDNKFFFNLSLFNYLQLESRGIIKDNFNLMYNNCTICNDLWCSYRREGIKAKRQLAIVALK